MAGAVTQARIRPRGRLAGVYMGVGKKDTSFGSGQIQWSAGGPVSNPTPGPVFHPQIYPIRAKVPVHPRTYGGRCAGIVPKIIQLVNTAEGGTPGVTATPGDTGGASGNAFDAVPIV